MKAISLDMEPDLIDRIDQAAGPRKRADFIRGGVELRLALRRMGLPERVEDIAAVMLPIQDNPVAAGRASR